MRATSSLLKEKRDKRAAAGLKPKPVRTMILGIPNVGKSTLINRLANRASTRTANTPGVTKAQQWIKVGDTFELLDTPGVLWPKFDDPEVGLKLAATGAIKDSILPIHDVAMYITDVMISHYPERLKARYGIDEVTTIPALHTHIGTTRGALAKGGEIDQDRVNRIIISDLRNNKFGGVSFDRTP
jgi:ribosome biogenesis GTPase A